MPSISAVLIVKNEQQHIEACLTPLTTAVDEIIVVDTGSEDDTLAIARKFTNHCYNFNWNDDFAAARNFALEKASSDNVLVVDADEYLLHPHDARQHLDAFIQQHDENTLGTIEIINQVVAGSDQQDTIDHTRRFFRHSRFHFQGPIHEQIVPRENRPTDTREAPTHLTVKHSGYAQSTHAPDHKAHRNIRLLKKALAQFPQDEYYHYQLGKAHFSLKQFPQAVEALDDALRNIQFHEAHPPQGRAGALSRELLTDLIVSLAYANNLPAAQQLLEKQHDLKHAGTQRADFHHVRGYVYLMLGDVPRAIQAYTEAQQYGRSGEDVRGTGTYSSAYHLALLSEATQDLTNAIAYQHQALTQKPDYLPSIARCIDLITEGPRDLPNEIWDTADQDTFSKTYIEKLQNFLDNADIESATKLVTAAAALSPELLTRCKASLEQFLQ